MFWFVQKENNTAGLTVHPLKVCLQGSPPLTLGPEVGEGLHCSLIRGLPHAQTVCAKSGLC